MQVQAVVFDIGNVLIDWNPQRYYDRVIGADRRRALFAAVDLDGLNLSLDAGADLNDTVEEVAAAHPDHAAEIRMWRDNWLEFVAGPIHGSVALLQDLHKAGTPVFALSNFGHAPLALADRAYPFLRDFDRRYISAELGVCKPDPRIYAAVEQGSGLPPGALYFIDDKPENIAAASVRGWQTHLFTGAETLVADLAARDVAGVSRHA